MTNATGKTLKQIIAEKQIENAIALKLASGKFQNTGKLYSQSEAIADSSNSALRMTATIDSNNNLVWSK